ncbi:MAG: sterol desaturase family protein [Alphaproteobacteria bacterium]|nr:sterol desaturase family protein [Alphaproteobacteria bacterium]
MPDAVLDQKATDELNLRLSVAFNTAVPFLLFGMALGQTSLVAVPVLFWWIMGLIGYSLVEYAFHRWILHGLVKHGHHLHHFEPFAPHAMPFCAGLCVHTLLLVILSLSLGLDLALCITLGSSTGYALYCQLHELIHRDPSLARRLVPRLHRHHMLHHRTGNASAGDACNYGVLTTFWDRLFATFRP